MKPWQARLIGLCAVALPMAASGHELAPYSISTPPAELLKAYAHAACVAQAYEGTPVAEDAWRISYTLRESLPTTPPETFAALRAHVKSKNPGAPAIKNGANFGLLACLDIFNSHELRVLVRKLHKH